MKVVGVEVRGPGGGREGGEGVVGAGGEEEGVEAEGGRAEVGGFAGGFDDEE